MQRSSHNAARLENWQAALQAQQGTHNNIEHGRGTFNVNIDCGDAATVVYQWGGKQESYVWLNWVTGRT
jgi:hypothetical protein